jgi:hypothetical protein
MASNDDVDVARIELHAAAQPARVFGRDGIRVSAFSTSSMRASTRYFDRLGAPHRLRPPWRPGTRLSVRFCPAMLERGRRGLLSLTRALIKSTKVWHLQNEDV